MRLSSGQIFEARLGFDRNGPNEAEQFTAQGRHDLGLVFASGRQVFVALVETALGFPGNGFNFRIQGQRLLSFEQEATSGAGNGIDVGVNNQPQNALNRRAEYGLTESDINQRLVGSAVWLLPYGKGRQFGSAANRGRSCCSEVGSSLRS